MDRPAIIEDYRDNPGLRNKFYAFVKTVFPGADFTEWFSRGFWKDGYIPFSIVENDAIVANVSITKMTVILDGQKLRGLQFGTVGTIPEYRRRGLSRLLMEYVLDKYRDSMDLFFLFANESVIDFYPRFGFQRHHETVFRSTADLPGSAFNARQLDIRQPSDLARIQNLLSCRTDLTRRFGAADYDFITLWHLLNVFPENICYLDDHNAAFIVTEKDGHVNLWDVICDKPFDLSSALPQIISLENPRSISYHFPPDRFTFGYDDTVIPDDSPLFIRGPFAPGDSPFKFPATAQT